MTICVYSGIWLKLSRIEQQNNLVYDKGHNVKEEENIAKWM